MALTSISDPSPAFSTLGWFDDPLLSTMLKYDDIAIVNTVIHEITHNTMWIPGHATFNETLANVIGALGAIQYFETNEGLDNSRTRAARDRWSDEQDYAAFIGALAKELKDFYSACEEKCPEEDILRKREAIFESYRQKWSNEKIQLKTVRYKQLKLKLNNAVVNAQTIYLDRIEVFVNCHALLGSDLGLFIDAAKDWSENYDSGEEDPFLSFEKYVQNTLN